MLRLTEVKNFTTYTFLNIVQVMDILNILYWRFVKFKVTCFQIIVILYIESN